MSKSKFYDLIKNATIEKDVENVYTQGINLYFPNVQVEHPFACDGFVDTKNDKGKLLKLIIEYKFEEEFTSKTVRAKVITQVLYYMKRFEQNGLILPNVVMVGDVNECFVFHTNDIISYLDEDLDWSIAPSKAHEHNAELIYKLANDENINPFIFVIDENFSFKSVVDKIYDLSNNIQRYVHVTEHNIATIFEYFTNRVISDKKKISANDIVAVFMGVITKNSEYYKHPIKKNILVTPQGEIKINGDGFDSFFSYFNRNYTPQEKMRFSEISDRLIEDTNRRNKGEFYTPTLFVDYAHDMISKAFGEDWKEKYVVWDNCYDKDTEFLSQFGWKKISDYKDGDLVMQYNQDGTTNFVVPKRYVAQEYTDEWVHLYGSQLDIKCTKDHNFLVKNDKKDRDCSLKKIPAIDVLKYSKTVKNTHLVIPKVFSFDGSISVDENIIRLAVAINADGYYAPKTTLCGNSIRTSKNTRFTENDTSVRDCYIVSVKKERKAKRMHNLLNNANIEYKYSETSGGYKQFTFHFPFNPKHFPTDWYSLDIPSKMVFIDEIFFWDGSIVRDKFGERKSYSTSKKDDADLVEFIFTSCGYSVNFRCDNRGGIKTNYQLKANKIRQAKISNPHNTFRLEENIDGMCYCFEVESGMLVIRRNNKICIGSNCSGTKNLTRDYYFKELYSSTLEQAELDISKQYNKEATSFQFDFLNDSLDKLPKGLLEAFEQNKPIIFFMNPPYATAANGKTDSESKKGCAKTAINDEMVKAGFGNGSRNLYAQFLYRIAEIKKQYNLTDCHIGLFSPTLFLSGISYKVFRGYFCKEFAYNSGVQFKASHFADVADNWGISFSIWNSGETIDKNNFNYNLIDNIDGEIEVIGEKDVYNTDGLTTASDWAKSTSKNEKVEQVYLTSAIKVKESDSFKAYTLKKSIGGFVNSGNNVDNNTQSCYLTCGSISTATGAITHIMDDNFDKCTALFAARRLVSCNWVNWADEYLAPNTEHSKWNEFVNDSLIYSLFESKSNQSSLRQVEYKGKLWDIKNEFFWMSREEMKQLANENGNDVCYQDANVSTDRYVYNLLQNITLSEEAQLVLDKACELVRKTFKYRMMFDEDNENYQINNWDCGWYQIKALAKEYAKDDFEEFKSLYKKLGDKMRPMVYELGFLRK